MPGNSSNFKLLFSIKLFENYDKNQKFEKSQNVYYKKSLILVKDIDNSKIIKIPYAYKKY